MRIPAKNVAWLLPLLLTACFHRHHQAQVQPTAPPLQPVPPSSAPTPAVVQPPVGTIPTKPASAATLTPPSTPVHPVHHPKPENTNVEQASNETPAVSAIGQLSSGDPSAMRNDTIESLAATERALNGITRTLSEQEQKTAAQIREFLKQAKAALANGNVDGAHTLALKAKVLLGEIVH